MTNMFKSVDQVISKYFKDPALIELITLFVAPFGNIREKESFFVWYMSDIAYHAEGAWYPQGGAGEFTRAFAGHYEKLGGKLLLNHEVTKILFQKKKAHGILCRDKKGGEHTISCNVLVNAADLYRFSHDLVPSGIFKQKWLDNIAHHEPQNSLVNVFLGLELDVKDYGITDYELWHLNSEWRTPDHYNRIFNQRDYTQLPMEVVTFYNNGPDKSCCPSGKSVISILSPTLIEPWNNLLENGKKGQKYKAEKTKIGEIFINRLATLLKIPDLAQHVEVIEVATPITIYRHNYAFKGTPIGY
jgi:phytoene dehydrogenase-like protein